MSNIQFHLNEIKKLLDSFHALTGIRIGLFDAEYNEIYDQPEEMSVFCSLFRSDPLINRKCMDCDITGFKAAEQKDDVHIYRCHSGLTEASIALRYEGTLSGFLMIGQFRTGTDGPSDLVHEDLRAEFNHLPVIGRKELSDAANILKACVGYILYKEWFQRNEKSPDERIRRFIEVNFRDKIKLADVAKAALMSKSALCKHISDTHGCTLSDMIETRRMEEARLLLTETNDPIFRISISCGYTDANYFSRRFKEHEGVTPRKYRLVVR
ncbi:MAG: PocR ligand-binding domain-containing protein [Eubacteriales bacterium]|nr:PocR ligand-binding domain-containing protein [Eubacteriales bacterium]